jgi:hypothetical protein
MRKKRPDYEFTIDTQSSYDIITQNEEMIQSLLSRGVERMMHRDPPDAYYYIQLTEKELETVLDLIKEGISISLMPFADRRFRINIIVYNREFQENDFSVFLGVEFRVHPWWASDAGWSITKDSSYFKYWISGGIHLDEIERYSSDHDTLFELYYIQLHQNMAQKLRDAMGLYHTNN